MPKEFIRQAPEPSRADIDFNQAIKKINQKYGTDLSAFLTAVRAQHESEMETKEAAEPRPKS